MSDDATALIRASLNQAVRDAERRGVEVLHGIPMTPEELAALERDLGVRFPLDYRAVALEFGALSFRRADEGVHYLTYGKPGPGLAPLGLDLDLRAAAALFRPELLVFDEDGPPAAVVVPVAAKLDRPYGHEEVILVDNDGRYRDVFPGGPISPPRTLVDIQSLFPWFVKMFAEDGRRLRPAELLALVNS